ncbi:hypothetical protein [Streptomyces lomondensis]|uniref:Nucleotide exchange factor GrpE n=1 Tax=Streptomyces lomondensis TaxID=68229 RepID=A0ABQ2XAB8_9ACTN|nr:hypothetical protein [Streptomyces lomondensis]MCF0077062.1 hypothetical protein [Streptomyces lomondensis]GGX07018.1 hypothetical protein GCM10010383_41360 [Streptomyces lomondensis]
MSFHSRRGDRTGRVRASLGQLRHPPEFRVPPPFLDTGQAAWVTAVLDDVRTATAATTEEPAADGAQGADASTLLAAATGLWRAQRKLNQRAGDLPAADLRQVRRYLQTGRQALADGGLEIQEHDGDPFDPGQSLEVLAFQDEPGLTREVVLETLRPSVYYRGERIQMGQVVVGRPAPGATHGT